MATPKRRIVLSLDTYLSILAVVSSFCALGITFYQAYLQRTQQYASVMPVLDQYVNNADLNDGRYRFEYIFVNNGIGPAFIKEYTYFYKNKPATSFSDVIRQIAIDKIGLRRMASLDTLAAKDIIFSGFWVNRIIPVNQEVKLVSINNDQLGRWVSEALQRGHINVKIRYASIYNEEWVFESRPPKIELRNVKVAR